jgi:rare lipoprotein A
LWTAASAQSVQPPSESGIASWYGAPYHGQRSASGEIYDQEKLTAAHRTLPFGTKVRVRRPDREGSVVVRINDRGPFVKSRVIDLSHAAAVQLGMTGGGVAPVILEVVETPPLNPRPL